MMRLNRMLPLVLAEDWIAPTPVPAMRAGALLSVIASSTEARRRDRLRTGMRILRQRTFGRVGFGIKEGVMRNRLVRQSDNGPEEDDEQDECPDCGAAPGEVHTWECGQSEEHADERDGGIPKPGMI